MGLTLIVIGLPLIVALVGVLLAIPKSTRTAGFVLLGLGIAGVAMSAVVIAVLLSASKM